MSAGWEILSPEVAGRESIDRSAFIGPPDSVIVSCDGPGPFGEAKDKREWIDSVPKLLASHRCSVDHHEMVNIDAPHVHWKEIACKIGNSIKKPKRGVL